MRESWEDLNERGVGLGPEDERAIVDLLVDRVEFCDTAVINKCDLVDEGTIGRIAAGTTQPPSGLRPARS